MALMVGTDGLGDWAIVECDRRGCGCHVAIRPGEATQTRYDLACAAFDMADDEGWRLAGRTYCPQHALERPSARQRVADGYSWARTVVEGVKGGRRPA